MNFGLRRSKMKLKKIIPHKSATLPPMNQNTLGALLALLAFTGYSLADVALKYAGQSFNFYQVAFYTQGFGVLAILTYAAITKSSLKTRHPKLQFYRSLSYAICYGLIIYAFQNKSLAQTYTIFYVCPFFTAIFSVLILREKIGKHRLISIIIGFLGVLIILRPDQLQLDWVSMGILLAAALFGYANVLTRKIGEDEPKIAFTLYTTAFILMVNAIPFAFNPVLPQGLNLAALATNGIIESIATAVLALAYLKAHAVTVTKMMYTSIIWAFLWGYLIFDDVLVDKLTFIGGTIIIGSGLYMIYRENKVAKTPA